MRLSGLVRSGLLLGLLAWAGPACGGQEFTARVVEVVDGDTLTVRRGTADVRVRIFGIDAPESGQAYGAEARDEARRLLQGRDVAVRQRDVDQYERIVAELRVGDVDVGPALIRAGAAWNYAYFSEDERYAALEAEARRAGLGLWRAPEPVAPWRWRAEAAARTSVEAPFVGNRRSQVFHARGCESFDCPNCTEPFESSDAARAAGYRPHAACVR